MGQVPKFKDYYEVLGVPPRSHHRVIEETYWERAHELHGVPTRKAQQRLSALNEAYETLGTPYKRLEYDRRHRAHRDGDEAEQGGAAGFIQQILNILSKPFRPD
jgi:curved DNA-binding protein CbpA